LQRQFLRSWGARPNGGDGSVPLTVVFIGDLQGNARVFRGAKRGLNLIPHASPLIYAVTISVDTSKYSSEYL
jgi:hypothetical protein